MPGYEASGLFVLLFFVSVFVFVSEQIIAPSGSSSAWTIFLLTEKAYSHIPGEEVFRKMARATAISISKLSTAAHAAATAALAKANLPGAVEPGVIYGHPWIIGIIIRNPDLTHIAKYQAVAEHITTGLSKVELNPQPLPPGESPALNPQPLPPAESASLYVHDHIIICGFLPVDKLPTTLAE